MLGVYLIINCRTIARQVWLRASGAIAVPERDRCTALWPQRKPLPLSWRCTLWLVSKVYLGLNLSTFHKKENAEMEGKQSGVCAATVGK